MAINPPLTRWERVRSWFLSTYVVPWLIRRELRRKYIWKCYGYANGQGTGVLAIPKPMTEEQALAWLRKAMDGAVSYIDREHHFIFYKPKQ